jgi:hypothetical protein
VYYNDQFGWSDATSNTPLKRNLLLIGGPDANRLTKEVLERLSLGIEFLEVSPRYLDNMRRRQANPESVIDANGRSGRRRGRRQPLRDAVRRPSWRIPVLLDKQDNRLLGPVRQIDGLRTDCGVIIRCPNPFNPDAEVVIFCGSYGYGSWAAVQFAQSREFLDHIPRRARFIECVLTVDVVRETPQKIQVELLRPLEAVTLAPDAAIAVPRIVW